MSDQRSQQLAEEALRALCWGVPTRRDTASIARALEMELGTVLEYAVLSKTLCLLAAHLHQTSVPGLPRPAARFFASTLRTNRYKTMVYRREAVTLTAALHDAGVPVAVLGGLGVEHVLYGGTGARQFNDLDLLITPQHTAQASAVLHERGYVANRPGGPWLRHSEDPIVPLYVVDLKTSLLRAHTDESVGTLLSRHVEQVLPHHDIPLPVLDPADALEHTLVRLGTATNSDASPARPRWLLAADALRLSRVASLLGTCGPAARNGWTALRASWPLLPAEPSSVHGSALESR